MIIDRSNLNVSSHYFVSCTVRDVVGMRVCRCTRDHRKPNVQLYTPSSVLRAMRKRKRTRKRKRKRKRKEKGKHNIEISIFKWQFLPRIKVTESSSFLLLFLIIQCERGIDSRDRQPQARAILIDLGCR